MLRNVVLIMFLLGSTLCRAAEVYPARTVRIIVSAAPGGVVDITGRVIAQQLTEQAGKSFIVENRTGAGGIVVTGHVAKSAPDGYTLLLATPGFTIVPGLHKSLPYDAATDFSPITQISAATQVFVVPPSLKAHTMQEFVAIAQANPGKLNYGSGGQGSPLHVYAELFSKAAKVKLVHIPYKGGGGESMTALMSEAGIPGMAIYALYGLVGPAEMPRSIVNPLRAEVVKAIAVPSVREKFAAQDAELIGSTPEAFGELIRSELRRWADIIKSAGITVE